MRSEVESALGGGPKSGQETVLEGLLEKWESRASGELERKRRRFEDDLSVFVRKAWEAAPFLSHNLVWNWHLDLLCGVLERVYRGEIRNLLLLAPPRHTKSLLASVFWPAWVWARDPGFEWIYGSHLQSLSRRDTRRMRQIVEGDWYRGLWGEEVVPSRETWSQTELEVGAGGSRLATSVGSGPTGRGGDAIVVDDPMDIDDARSKEVRESTYEWFVDAMASRLNQPKRGRKVVVGQRVHPRDLPGRILDGEVGSGWEVVQLPGLYEEDLSVVTPEGLEDERTVEGEPLHPERADESALRSLVPGSEAVFRTIIQQDARSRGGQLFDSADVERVEGDLKDPKVRIVAIDKAGTPEEEAGPATSYTAMVQLAMDEDRTTRVEDVERGRWSAGPRERKILDFCERVASRLENRPDIGDSKRAFTVYVEQEPGSSGQDSARATVSMLQKNGFRAEADPATGDKFGRMDPFAGAVERGEVSVKRGEDWTQPFLQELDDTAPGAPIVDQTDAAARAYNCGIEEMSEQGSGRGLAFSTGR